jgi:hypothetical protein
MLRIITVLSAVMLFSFTSAAFAGDTLLSIGLGIDFATGKYGTGSNTDSISVPLTIRAYPLARLDLELILPYIYQSNGTTTAAGMFRFKNGKSGSGSGKGNGQSQGAADSDRSGSRSGIGDMTFKAGYALLEESKISPRIVPEVSLRIPTGDDEKGLGTGEFAAGVGIEISKWLGEWYLYGEGIYNFQDSSEDLALKDYLAYEAGVGFQVTDRFRPALVVIGATSPSVFSSAIAEVRAKVNYRLTGRAGLEGYLATGIADVSPDFGAGATIFYDF